MPYNKMPSSSLTPKPPTLLRVSESQAISNSSSFISSTSSSLFDRISGASSGYLTDLSSPFTPSTAEFGNREGEVSVTQSSDSPTKEPVGSWSRHDTALFSPQSRLPQRTNISLTNRLDRACALGPRSSARSYSQNGTPFVSLIPIAVARNKDRRYHPDSEDTFDAFTILRNRLERGNPTVATRRALKFMDPGGRPPVVHKSVGRVVETPVTVIVTRPDSPVEDWSDDFELGSARDVKVRPELPPDVNTVIDQFSNSESDLDEDWFNALEIAAAHSHILFPSTSGRSLGDVEQDTESSPIPLVELPSKPVLEPVTSDSPCSPFILGTPDLSANWEGSRSSLSTLMAESPPSPIISPANTSVDEEEMARIMHTLLSFPARTRQPFTGSPEGDVDVATVMRLEIAARFSADHPHPHASPTRTLIGLGVAMPTIHPPLPPTLFPFHHPPGETLSSSSLRDLGYQSFDDKMFEIESLAILSRNVEEPSLPENVETDSGLAFAINESLLYSPLEGCTPLTPLLSKVDFECNDAFQVEQALSLAHTPSNHTSPVVFGKALVGLGLGVLTEASVESQPTPAEPSPTTTGHHPVSADKSVTEVEAAPLPVSEFCLQVQNSLIFEPLGAQKSIELDASQLERQSALYNLEHTDLLDYIFSYSPPIQIEERSEIERQLLSKKQSHSPSKSQRYTHNLLFSSPTLSLRQGYNNPCTVTANGVKKFPHSVKQLAVSDERSIFSKRSYQVLKKLGLERLAIFRPRSGRNDLDLTSPAVTPKDDPRSPYQSTLERVFLTFTSINPPEMYSPMKSASASAGLDIKQHHGSEDPSKSNTNMRIGLGLPSHLAFRRSRLQEMSSRGTIDSFRCRSRRSSQEYQNPSFIVTEPPFASPSSRVQSDESDENLNQLLKPSHFAQRSLYDIVEVPTPPSSTSSSPLGTPSPRNQWSSPFTRLKPPQKKQSFRSQLSKPSAGSPLTESSVHADTEVGAIDVIPSLEVSMTSTASARPGFKQFISKVAKDLFKRSRSFKTSELVSPVLIEHADAPPGLGLLRQENHCASCGSGTREVDFTTSAHKLQLLF